jgi:pyruvate dehydrogenase (quinone)/pyruvate oxidase
MARTAADVLIDTLTEWGVEVIFGLPGDGINGIMESLRTHQDRIRFVQVRHEEVAAFAACAYAKYTGRLGVCLATSGPGGIHLLNGLYDAKMDGQPVLAIAGHHYHDLIDTNSQQDVDLDRVYEDVAVYNTRVMGPAHVRPVTDIACRKALSYRGVSCITFPTDIQEQQIDAGQREHRNLPGHTSSAWARAAGLPSEQDLHAAAEILNAGKKVALMAGRGALGAGPEIEQMAEILGAPVIKPLLGKCVLPDDSPYTTGGIGLLGTGPSEEALEECDTLFIVGTSFPYIEFYPKPGKARGVQLDIDPGRIGLRYPVEVGLVGDTRNTLRALLPMLHRNENRDFLDKARQGMNDWFELMRDRGTRQDMPMKPQVVAHELNKLLPDDAIISTDSGTITTWAARQIMAKKNQKFSCSGTLATMACAMPYAIGAAIAYPDRMSVAFVGDGGFTMLMGDLATCVKYNLNVKIIIIKNNVLGQIKWEQMVFLGNPEFGVELQPIDFAAVARAFGATAFSIDQPAHCADTLAQALNMPGPVVIEAIVDPLEPPLPAKTTVRQATGFAESILRGEPDGGKIIANVLKTKVREMV